MRTIICFMILITTILLLIGCALEPSTPTTPTPTGPSKTEIAKMDYCDKDSDCVCGGVDSYNKKCFLGNKDYQKKYVDTTKGCPDFCNGIAGNLATKCVANKCMQVYQCLTKGDCTTDQKCVNNKCVSKTAKSDCTADSECRRGGCSGQVCESVNNEPKVTTCEYRPEYSCYKYAKCGCTQGKCAWQTSSEYDTCVKAASEGPDEVRS